MIIKIRNEDKNGWKYIDEVREIEVVSDDDAYSINVIRSDGSTESRTLVTETYLLNDKGDTLNRLHK